jgi:hypothetical protein
MAYKEPLATGRKYPDGESIPDSLPSLYRPSPLCNNCLAYVPDTKYCITWDAVVRPEYICAAWTPILKT